MKLAVVSFAGCTNMRIAAFSGSYEQKSETLTHRPKYIGCESDVRRDPVRHGGLLRMIQIRMEIRGQLAISKSET